MRTLWKRRTIPRVLLILVATGLFVVGAGAQDEREPEETGKNDEDKPSLGLRATPRFGFAPMRVFLVAEVKGGSDDYEDMYCPSVEWEWGDGTRSLATYDCQPYESGKSDIKRRYPVEHMFKRSGRFNVRFTLKKQDAVVASVATTLVVRQNPGVGY